MTEKNDDDTIDVDQADSGIHETSSSTIPNSIQSTVLNEMRSQHEEIMKELKIVKTQFGDQQKVLEKLQSIENQLEELKPQKILTEEPNPEVTEEKESAEEKQKTPDPLVSKQFVLKHMFRNMSGAEENKQFDSESEEHFGVKWFFFIRRENENLACFLQCQWPETKSKWLIETEFEIRANGLNNKVHTSKATYCYLQKIGYGFAKFLKWDEMEKNYLTDGSLKVEVHVKIKKTTGIYKENLRKFDESMSDISDITLIVNDEKFHVAKLFLAAHSSYFKAMFLGMFGDAKKPEITLTGVDRDDFQKYLELLYGESTVEETAVEGILLVADMYDTQILVQKCEDFLMKESKKTLKKKLQMSVRYNLKSLKKKCISEIKTAYEIRSVFPSDPRELEPSLAAELLQRMLSFK